METLDAIVVGHAPVGEADLVVKLLTPGIGRLAVFARSARRAGRGLSGRLELGVCVQLNLKLRRDGMPLLNSADVLRAPRLARESLKGIAYLAYGCELCAALAPEQAEAERLYGLLGAWLAGLEGEGGLGRTARVALEAKALTFAGLAPSLVRCVVCGEIADEPMVFSAEAGGAAHAHCGQGRAISVEHLAFLERLRRTPLAELGAVNTPPSLATLLSDFAGWQLGRRLNSWSLVVEAE